MGTGAPISRPIPLARSILWAPASGGPRPGDLPFPVFLAQDALTAIHEHAATPVRSGQGVLGFLFGDLCECPETNVSYLVIDAAVRLTQTIYGDRSRDVVTGIWDRLETQLEEQQAHLIGWYHTHPPLPLVLSPDDIETHEHYFGEPWQVAMLIATDAADPAGAFFRASSDAWVSTPLPFYELLNEDSIRPDGKRRSFLTWKNYRAYNPVVPQAASAPQAPAWKPPAEPKPTRAAPLPEPEPSPPPPPAPPPREERTQELKFLTTAEDFAVPAPPRADPLPGPPPLRPPPPRARAPEPPPEVEEPIPTEAAGEETGEEAAAVWPEEFEARAEVAEHEEPAEPAAVPARPRPRRRRRNWRRLRRALLVLGLIGGAGVGFWWFQPQLPSVKWSTVTAQWVVIRSKWSAITSRLRRPRPSPAPSRPAASAASRRPAQPAPASGPVTVPPHAVPAPSPYTTLDRIGDAVGLGMRSFNDRAALVESKQADCGGLAQELASVEERWVAYTTARRGAGVLDAAHATRDQRLYAGVDSVERRFEKSGCDRP